MKISLFQGILFGVFGLAALIGVFVFATHTGTNTGGTASTIGTVVVWGTLPKADMQTALTAITQADPTMKGVSYVQKDESTLPTELASAIATGAAPDLVLASQEDLSSLSKLITPVPTSTLSASAFDAAFVGEGRLFATPDGSGYYGVPFLVDPLVLFSNHAILASDGIAKPPATWEALTGLVPNVALLTPTKQITRGLIALGTYSNIHAARGILSALLLQTGVPISSYANGALVADLSGTATSGQAPGTAVLNFYTQFADPSKVSYTWNSSLPDSQQAFLAGDLALYIGYASEARFLTAANPNLDFNVSPLPQPATATLKSTYGLVYAFMIPRGAKNMSGAYQAAVLLSGSAAQNVAAPALGLAPAALTPLTTAPADPVAAVAYAEALYAAGWLSPAPADTDTVFSSMITSVISGRLTPDNALTSGENSLTSLLQK
ncbi:MAG TPA: extracellular solute-binding protein [Candidatus Paceibacterota bacterium]|nr:extracellular solute-binding protein [Candidatus Paceibacterota bacterium]